MLCEILYFYMMAINVFYIPQIDLAKCPDNFLWFTGRLHEDTSAFHTDQFLEHVKEMHEGQDKGFEEEFKVSETWHQNLL